MRSAHLRIVCALALAGGVVASAAPPAGAQWAGSSAITRWNGSCGGSTRDWWDDMCKAWRTTMASLGWEPWYANYQYVTGERYADDDVVDWGEDDFASGLDWNDAGMLCTHGGWKSGQWHGTLYDKDPDGSCSASAANMLLGGSSGGWLRFLHLSSCNSIRYDQRTQWFDAADGVHVVTGFHGYMYIGSDYVGEYSQLALFSMYFAGVGKNWVSFMHHVDHWYNSYSTVCPVSVAFGDSPESARAGQGEAYTAYLDDPDPEWMNTRWNSGCDPDDGPPLP